jgi:hypothetical protein
MKLKRFVPFILDIGADARDSEYVRLIKRIWYAATTASLPISLLSALSEVRAGHGMLAASFFFAFLLFLAVLVDGARAPRHFERNTLIVLVFFVLAPAIITVTAGGIWHASGSIMIGLLGPLFALMLPDKRWAFCLFGLYVALVLILTGIWPFPGDRAFLAAGFDQFQFWLGFVVLPAFVFGGMYFFVVQRDKAHRLLGLEKDKSESLLRRIEKDVEQAAEIQKRLLPARDPVLEGFDISGANIPCYQVGGRLLRFCSHRRRPAGPRHRRRLGKRDQRRVAHGLAPGGASSRGPSGLRHRAHGRPPQRFHPQELGLERFHHVLLR